MDIKTIKNIPISTVMSRLGFCIIRTNDSSLWYKSPFRNEMTASFKVDSKKNLYYDFGEGKGGNVFDLIMRIKDCNFKEALHFLRNEYDSFSFHQTQSDIELKKKENQQSYEIDQIKPLANFILIEYLKSRKLNIELCKIYLVEVYYQLNNKQYFGIGFKNDSGGTEIRNKYVKLCLGKKWYTSIKNKSNQLIVLESWSDFISLLMLFSKTENQFDFIILNSLSMLNKLDTVYEEYEKVFLALDNDEAGTKATQKQLEILGAKCTDIRYLYNNGSKDLNDYLLRNY
ncbi:toprim domain-containing protein [Flavobacterium sp. xlx-214]|uniref:toprim domain-containing protein n=1 Tax=unclassified Flavobacterium TaxID=196869 RepID=UPI0013D83B29|nr:MULTISPECIES: toprim domain-containing protein [unclassified Flavobacterium]MBA5791666.1 toprim domain-containing protein [Flavobacterium sp. xlx-221]QMI82909.1 toprim domain-containing protein [Flavobacterium sp. xlx-214]